MWVSLPTPACERAKALSSWASLCDPIHCSPPGSSVHGDSPGRNAGVGCRALLQGNLPNPGIEPVSLMSPALAGGLFKTGATWEAPLTPENLPVREMGVTGAVFRWGQSLGVSAVYPGLVGVWWRFSVPWTESRAGGVLPQVYPCPPTLLLSPVRPPGWRRALVGMCAHPSGFQLLRLHETPSLGCLGALSSFRCPAHFS